MILTKGLLRKIPAESEAVEVGQSSGWSWRRSKPKPVPAIPSWVRLGDPTDPSSVATLANAQSIDVHPHLISDCGKAYTHPEYVTPLKAPKLKTLRLWMNRFYNNDGESERVFIHNHEPHTHFLHSQCHLLGALRPKTLVLRNVTLVRTKLIPLTIPRDVLKYVTHLVLVVLPNREDAHSTSDDDRHCALSYLCSDLARIKHITVVFQTLDRYRAWRPYPEGGSFSSSKDKDDDLSSDNWETETLVGHDSKKPSSKAVAERHDYQRSGREFKMPVNTPRDMMPWLDEIQRLWVAHIFDWAAQMIRTHHTIHLTLVHASALRPPQSAVTKGMTPHKFLLTIPWLIRGFVPKTKQHEPFPDRLRLMSMSTFLKQYGAEVYPGSKSMSAWPRSALLDAAEDTTLQALLTQPKELFSALKSSLFPQSPLPPHSPLPPKSPLPPLSPLPPHLLPPPQSPLPAQNYLAKVEAPLPERTPLSAHLPLPGAEKLSRPDLAKRILRCCQRKISTATAGLSRRSLTERNHVVY